MTIIDPPLLPSCKIVDQYLENTIEMLLAIHWYAILIRILRKNMHIYLFLSNSFRWFKSELSMGLRITMFSNWWDKFTVKTKANNNNSNRIFLWILCTSLLKQFFLNKTFRIQRKRSIRIFVSHNLLTVITFNGPFAIDNKRKI